ncbi:S-protein homologue 1 [Hibiscus trionum]|uniref:S-protein homolog n=1 Tax=Hibiscus trionum TaxID=183268 RepID=A0A9W7IU21_HIBTR|nr:S-protein homologue 1 [Hibiscus trionum]
MSSFRRNVYFFLVLATLMAANPSASTSSAPTKDQQNILYKTWHVHAVNGLSSNKILLVHCKSHDDDLGIHNLTAGNEFQWKFKPNIFGKTLFWCLMDSVFDRVHAVFNVFWDNENLFYRCDWDSCFWIAKDDGIYLKNIPENYDEFMHNWENGRGALANFTIL